MYIVNKYLKLKLFVIKNEDVCEKECDWLHFSFTDHVMCLVLDCVIEYEASTKSRGFLLVVNGIRFFRNRRRGNKQYWKCHRYYKDRCPTIVIVDEATNHAKIIYTHKHAIEEKAAY